MKRTLLLTAASFLSLVVFWQFEWTRLHAVQSPAFPKSWRLHLATNDSNKMVRAVAIERIHDEVSLKHIVFSSDYLETQQEALLRIENREVIGQIAQSGLPLALRLEAIARVDDPAILGYLIREGRGKKERTAAVRQLRDEAMMLACYYDLGRDAEWDLQDELLDKIEDQDSLFEIYRGPLSDRDRDKAFLRIRDEGYLVQIAMNGPERLRMRALKRLKGASMLAEVALNSERENVALAASSLLKDGQYLVPVALRAKVWKARASAERRIDNEADALRLLAASSFSFGANAVDHIRDSEILALIAFESPDAQIQARAIARVNDPQLLYKLSLEGLTEANRLLALSHINELESVAKVIVDADSGELRRQATARYIALVEEEGDARSSEELSYEEQLVESSFSAAEEIPAEHRDRLLEELLFVINRLHDDDLESVLGTILSVQANWEAIEEKYANRQTYPPLVFSKSGERIEIALRTSERESPLLLSFETEFRDSERDGKFKPLYIEGVYGSAENLFRKLVSDLPEATIVTLASKGYSHFDWEAHLKKERSKEEILELLRSDWLEDPHDYYLRMFTDDTIAQLAMDYGCGEKSRVHPNLIILFQRGRQDLISQVALYTHPRFVHTRRSAATWLTDIPTLVRLEAGDYDPYCSFEARKQLNSTEGLEVRADSIWLLDGEPIEPAVVDSRYARFQEFGATYLENEPRALAALATISDEDLLTEIALNEEVELKVRLQALAGVKEPHNVIRVALYGGHEALLRAARKRLETEAIRLEFVLSGGLKDPSSGSQSIVCENLEEQDSLIRVARAPVDWRIRQSAISRITDQDVLHELGFSDPQREIRQTAIVGLSDQSKLKDIALNSAFWDSRVTALGKLVEMDDLEEALSKESSPAIRNLIYDSMKLIGNSIDSNQFEEDGGDWLIGNSINSS